MHVHVPGIRRYDVSFSLCVCVRACFLLRLCTVDSTACHGAQYSMASARIIRSIHDKANTHVPVLLHCFNSQSIEIFFTVYKGARTQNND